MMLIPEHINTRWLKTLADDELVAAEAQLYDDFHRRDVAERSRAGSRYILLQGPATLVTAWHRWGLVSNEARARQLVVRHGRLK